MPKLTEKQTAYVEGRLNNKTKKQSAIDAGYSGVNTIIEKSDDVAAALQAARSNLATATKTTREDVLEMFKRAFDLAQLAAEPASMVASAREIGKMLGFYEPETIRVQMTVDQARLGDKFRMMSREELLEIAEGRARIVEGEFTRVS